MRRSIVGAWKRLSTRPLLPDGSPERAAGDWDLVKIVTKSHFMFVEQAPARARLRSGGVDAEWIEATRSFGAGCGTYRFDGVNYTETITHFLNPNYVGLSIHYTCEFRGSLWIQTGIFPLRSVGMPGEDCELVEVYECLE